MMYSRMAMNCGNRGAIQYSPEKCPENCPEKCPELSNCSNSYILNFLAVNFEGFFRKLFGIIFGTSSRAALNRAPDLQKKIGKQ